MQKNLITTEGYRINKGSQYLKNATLITYEGWNFNSGNYLFTTDTK